MPYERTQSDRIVHYRWYGEITPDDLRTIGRELPDLASRLGYAPDVLHTFADSVTGHVDAWTMFEESIRRRNTRLRNPVKAAWVAGKGPVLTAARMFQELNRNPDMKIEIFRSEKAARKWLGEASPKTGAAGTVAEAAPETR